MYIDTYVNIYIYMCDISHLMRIRDMLGNGKFDDGVFITFGWENNYAVPIDYELGLLSLKCVKCIFIAY